MGETQILFKGPMVRGILDDRKRVTRRVVALDSDVRWFGYPCDGDTADAHPKRRCHPPGPSQEHYHHANGFNHGSIFCPYGAPGDRLWVRETWSTIAELDHLKPSLLPKDAPIFYRATEDQGEGILRPSIFMPRWASRIDLVVTDTRVERLQDMTEEDAIAEGAPDTRGVWDGVLGDRGGPREWVRTLWNEINAKRGHSWDSNPWVWPIGFRRLRP